MSKALDIIGLTDERLRVMRLQHRTVLRTAGRERVTWDWEHTIALATLRAREKWAQEKCERHYGRIEKRAGYLIPKRIDCPFCQAELKAALEED